MRTSMKAVVIEGEHRVLYDVQSFIRVFDCHLCHSKCSLLDVRQEPIHLRRRAHTFLTAMPEASASGVDGWLAIGCRRYPELKTRSSRGQLPGGAIVATVGTDAT